MGRIPKHLRQTIARNIRECRIEKFGNRGGGKKCAEEFGVSPQQWSPWERASRTPDDLRLEQIAAFFGKTLEWMRTDHQSLPDEPVNEAPPPRPVNYQLLYEIMLHAAQLQKLCARALTEGIELPYPPAGAPPLNHHVP